MNENAIDVICPVYNAEKTIKRCIDSVLTQRHQNWKMIFIDDGSTDKSAEIIRGYVSKYPDKIYYFYQENAGPFSARNLGIEKGSSPYICFIDSDDFIDEDWLESFNTAVVENTEKEEDSSQIFVFNGFTYTTRQLTTHRIYKATININDNSTNILSKFSELDPLVRGIMVTSLFKRSIIIENNIKFNTEISLFEDMIFKYDYLQYSRKIIIANSVGYYYVSNPESLANKKRNIKEFLLL